MKKLKLGILGMLVGVALTLASCGGGGGGGGAGGGGGGGGQTVAGLTFDLKALQSFLAGAFGAGVANNNSDQAVGMSDNGTAIKAALWTITDANPQPTALEPLAGGTYSAAYGINDSGIAVGESAANANTVAVFWGAGATTATALGTLGSAGFSAAYSVNNDGKIVGEEVVDGSGNTAPVFWSGTTAVPVNLGTLGGEFGSAYFISEGGLIVGEAEVAAGGAVHAAFWRPAAVAGTYQAPVALAPLAGHLSSVAFGIDGSGRIVGESEAADGTVHGVIWTLDAAGTVTGTEDLGAGTSLVAGNGVSRVVGFTAAGTGSDQAAIWDSANSADNQNLGPIFSQAYDVNDSTQVVGISGAQAFVAIPQ
jgi:uncharacterized membrane protein